MSSAPRSATRGSQPTRAGSALAPRARRARARAGASACSWGRPSLARSPLGDPLGDEVSRRAQPLREDPREVQQDSASQFGLTRREDLEGVEREPAHLAVAVRTHRARAWSTRDEAELADYGRRLDRLELLRTPVALGQQHRQRAARDDVERTVQVARADDYVARAERPRIGVRQQLLPVALAAIGQERQLIGDLVHLDVG